MVSELEAWGKKERRNFSVTSRPMIAGGKRKICTGKVYPKHCANVLPMRFNLNGNTKGV